MPHLTLIGSLTSPYVRKIRILLAEKKLPYEWILDDVWGQNPQVNAHNPLGQVPCLLVDQKDTVIDSRVIAEYLELLAPMHLPSEPMPRIEALKWAALTDGLMDAAAKYRVEQLRPDALQWSDWLDRQRGKLHAGLSLIETQLTTHPWLANDTYSVADIGLMCVLNFLDFRQPDYAWRESFPHIARWAQQLAQQPTFAETMPQ